MDISFFIKKLKKTKLSYRFYDNDFQRSMHSFARSDHLIKSRCFPDQKGLFCNSHTQNIATEGSHIVIIIIMAMDKNNNSRYITCMLGTYQITQINRMKAENINGNSFKCAVSFFEIIA